MYTGNFNIVSKLAMICKIRKFETDEYFIFSDQIVHIVITN